MSRCVCTNCNGYCAVFAVATCRFYVSTQVSSDRKTLPVDLLQCQLLSLVGVMPDEQILMSSSTGEVLYAPSKSNVSTVAVLAERRSRFFLFSSATSTSDAPEMASDWRQICTKGTFGDAAVVQPGFRKIAPPSGGDPLATLICEPCARTCTTGKCGAGSDTMVRYLQSCWCWLQISSL